MNNFFKCLKKLNVKSNDIVFIHSDTAILSQISIIQNENKVNLNEFIDYLIKYFTPSGTIIMPTYTYSFNISEDYNIKKSKSMVGQLTEIFRNFKGVKRSDHPIFSISTIGKYSDDFLKCNNHDCFGKNTVFDLMKKKNVKIIFLGCSVNSATFVHHVEQSFGVSYRYFNKFSGYIIKTKKKEFREINYFVRNLNIKKKLDLTFFEKTAIKKIF